MLEYLLFTPGSPGGAGVVSVAGQLTGPRAVEQHGPYLVPACPVRGKGDVPAVRRPAGFSLLPSFWVKRVTTVVCMSITYISKIPPERETYGQLRSVGRPRGGLIVLADEVSGARWCRLHSSRRSSVAAAIGGEGDFAAARIPRRGGVDPAAERDLAQPAAVGIDGVQIGLAVDVGCECDAFPVRGPCGRRVQACRRQRCSPSFLRRWNRPPGFARWFLPRCGSL